jgi:hypothetical protein
MEIFEGTIDGFIKYFGTSYFTNLIQRKTSRRRKMGVCEGFGTPSHSAQVQAAHLHGRGRLTIIREILTKHMSNGVVRCDIDTVVNEIWAAHLPIEDTFKFLCADCHAKYGVAERALMRRIDQPVQAPPAPRPTTPPAPSKSLLPPSKLSVEQTKVTVEQISGWATKRPRLIVHRIIAVAATHRGPFSREWLERELERRNIGSDPYGSIASLMSNSGNNYGIVFVKHAGELIFHPHIEYVIRQHSWAA